MLVRFAGQEKLDVLVVEIRTLGRRGSTLLVEEIQQDRELHRVAGEFVDVGLAALILKALPQGATVLALDPPDRAPFAQVRVPLVDGELVKGHDLEQVG